VKFKVGDKVKVIKKPVGCCGCRADSCDFMGRIGIICKIDEKRIGVNNFGYTNSWCSGFDENSIELAEKPPVKLYGIVTFCNTYYK